MAPLTIILAITGLFVAIAPAATFCLLALKGLPSFAAAHLTETLGWVYQVTWLAALFAGLLVSLVVVITVRRTGRFHMPYDFGRCFSLGAISGALAEGFATWLYREASRRPFSTFWIAGAILTGSLAGAAIVSAVVWRLSVRTPASPPRRP